MGNLPDHAPERGRRAQRPSWLNWGKGGGGRRRMEEGEEQQQRVFEVLQGFLGAFGPQGVSLQLRLVESLPGSRGSSRTAA